MIIAGLVLMLIGFVTGIWILFWLGVALLIIGVFLNFGGPIGPTGYRRRYY